MVDDNVYDEEFDNEGVRGNLEHLYGADKKSFDDINDSFKFKSELLKLSKETDGLISKDILLANLTSVDKKKALAWLQLSADCNDFGLHDSSLSFYKDVLLLSGITRGTGGFQQEKLNEHRDIKIAQLNNESRKRRWGAF